jgi:hypothetical protein
MLRLATISRIHAYRLTTIAALSLVVARGGFAQTLPVAGAAPAAASAADPSGSAGAAAAAPESDFYFEEPRIIAEPIDRARSLFGKDEGSTHKTGFYPEVSNMTTGAGWVSLGPGYRTYVFDRRLLLDGSAALSWHLYKMLQGRIEAPVSDRLVFGAQGMWQDQTQVNYFGPGPDSVEDDQTHYRITTTDVVGYTTFRASESVYFDARFGWLENPTLREASGTFRPDFPSTLVRFAAEPGVTGPQPSYLHGEFAATADTRDYKGHPTSGGLFRAALTTFSDRDAGTFSFNEYQAEALQLFPIVGKRWIAAVHGWLVLTDVPPGNDIPIYLQPSLGGNNTLRGYHTYRFHDQNALAINGESRWAVFEHVDVAAFFDAGNVASSAGDLDLAKTSYGGGVRVHTTRATFVRVDVARGSEGWHFVVRTTEPFRLSRITRSVADLPFAP